jgi:hypothetical protein
MRRGMTLVAGLAVVVLVGAGCTSSDDEGAEVSTASPEEMADLLAASVDQSADAGAARFLIEVSSATDDGSDCMALPAMSVEGASQTDTGAGWLDTDRDGDPDVVALEDELLVLAPSEWNAPTPWVSIDPDTDVNSVLAASSGGRFGGTPIGVSGGMSAETLVPTLDELLNDLTVAGAEITLLGPGDVRGVSTTGYQIRIDPLSAMTRTDLLGDERDASEASTGLPPYVVEVQVDGSGFIRRMQSTMDMPDSPTTDEAREPMLFGSPSISMLIELWDLGEPVDSPQVPRDQVSAFGDLVAGDVVDPDLGLGEMLRCAGGDAPNGPDDAAFDAFAACSAAAAEGKTVAEYATGDAGWGCMSELMGALPMPDVGADPAEQACLDALAALPPEDAGATIPPECGSIPGSDRLPRSLIGPG